MLFGDGVLQRISTRETLMNRKTVVLLAAIAALSSGQVLAQDYQLNHLDSRGFSGMAKQARVESLPSDFFGTDQAAKVPVVTNDVDTTSTNMLVLGAFAWRSREKPWPRPKACNG